MNKNWSLPVACMVCVLSLCAMVLALINNGKQEDVRLFSPPPFEKAAVSGMPTVPEELGWSEIYQDGMEFRAYICGNVIEKDDAADVYFTNSEEFDVWLKLRVLTADGTLLGETGLIRPGEYVKSVSLTSEVEDGTAIKLKIMAYEPDTYYSAGSVTLNTILREEGAE